VMDSRMVSGLQRSLYLNDFCTLLCTENGFWVRNWHSLSSYEWWHIFIGWYDCTVPVIYCFMYPEQTLWPSVHKRTIPTEQPPLVGEILCQLLWIEGCRMVSAADPSQSLISVF
jgi:hypothetical protein